MSENESKNPLDEMFYEMQGDLDMTAFRETALPVYYAMLNDVRVYIEESVSDGTAVLTSLEGREGAEEEDYLLRIYTNKNEIHDIEDDVVIAERGFRNLMKDYICDPCFRGLDMNPHSQYRLTLPEICISTTSNLFVRKEEEN